MTTSIGDWIDAGPFRAHLRQVMAVGELDEVEAATLFGLSTRAVTHIVRGRAGRPQRRISPDTARRLIQVDVSEVLSLRWCLTPVRSAQTALRLLREAGWDDAGVAARIRVPLSELRTLDRVPEAGTPHHCSRLLTLRLVSLARGLAAHSWDGDVTEIEVARAA